MTKIAVMPIYMVLPLKLFFSGTGGPISKTFGMLHQWEPGPIIVCSNDDPGLTLTYFTTRTKFANKAFI